MSHSFTFESGGKVKLPSDEELAKADGETAILAYSNGTTEDGRPYYAYVAVKPSKYKEFYALTAARQALVIAEYGSVIRGGFEKEPPLEVLNEMREIYGFDNEFQEKLAHEAKKQLVAFLQKEEEARIDGIVRMLQHKA